MSAGRRERVDVAALIDRVDLVALVSRHVSLKKRGRELEGLCPLHRERTPSFKVDPLKRRWKCFGCGAGGDAIGFVRAIEGVGFREAVERLGGPVLETPADRDRRARRESQARAADERERAAKAGTAAEIWRAARPSDGTPVEAYLAARGIDVGLVKAVHGGAMPRALRFAVLPYRHRDGDGLIEFGPVPCMVAGIARGGGPRGEGADLAGVHLTWLRPDGSGKAELVHPRTGEVLPAKKMRGSVQGGAIRFGPRLDRGCHLYAGEGIETALSVLAALARTGRRAPVWAALSLGNFAGGGRGPGPVKAIDPETGRAARRPSPVPDPAAPALIVPAAVRRFTWLGDADGKDPEDGRMLVARGLARLAGRGIETRVAWARPGQDFNDMARQAAEPAGAGDHQATKGTEGVG